MFSREFPVEVMLKILTQTVYSKLLTNNLRSLPLCAQIHTTNAARKEYGRMDNKEVARTLPKDDEGTQGESSIDIDSLVSG